jgi:hypothetical protein
LEDRRFLGCYLVTVCEFENNKNAILLYISENNFPID